MSKKFKNARRIAFLVNALSGDELEAGKKDVSLMRDALMSKEYGRCNDKSPKPLYDTKHYLELLKVLDDTLKGWRPNDQLLFYYSGHGDYQHNIYCFKFNGDGGSYLTFSMLMDSLKIRGVQSAIIIIDACYSGAVTRGTKSNLELLIPSKFDAEIPSGITIIGSCRETEISRETEDGSNSIFTRLLCDGINTGLGLKKTKNGLIYVEDIVEYINDKLKDDKYTKFNQHAFYKNYGSERQIWLSYNKSGSIVEKNIVPEIRGITNLQELEFSYKKTIPTLHPCKGASLKDLDWELIELYSNKTEDGLFKVKSKDEILRRLGIYSEILLEDKRFLHQSAVLCFLNHPEIFYPQAKTIFVVGDIGEENFKRIDVEGPILRQITRLIELAKKEINTISRIEKNGLRQEIADIDETVIRELIINSLAHRDYTSNGNVQVRFTTRYVEVISPGLFPENTTWDEWIESSSYSLPVNIAIVQYLSKLYGIEGIGRGFAVFRNYIKENGKESITCKMEIGPRTCIRVLRRRIGKTSFYMDTSNANFNQLPLSIQEGLSRIGLKILGFIFNEENVEFKSTIELDDGGKIFAKIWVDFRNSFLNETENDFIKFEVFQSFFENETTIVEISRLFTDKFNNFNFDELEDSFIEKCSQFGLGRVPDLNFRKTVYDLVDGIEDLIIKKTDLSKTVSQHRINNIRQFLDGFGVQRNFTLAKKIYIKQIVEVYNKLRFSGIPDLKEKKDIPLPSVFVMPRVTEDIPPQDYAFLKEDVEEHDKLPDEISLRERARKLTSFREGKPQKFDEAFREGRHDRLVVLGAPGSGKSSLVKYLALAFAQNQFKDWLKMDAVYFPVIIEIRSFEAKLNKTQNTGYNIYDFLYDFIRSDYQVSLPDGFFEKYLNSGKALLLFDGLDEVAEESRRIEIKDNIHAFINMLPGDSRVIITSRIAGYNRTRFSVEDYGHFTLLDFDDGEINEFNSKWYASRLENQAEAQQMSKDLSDTLEQKPQIRALAHNPLMLTIIGVIRRYETQLPEDRLTLYEKASVSLLYTWDNVKQIINRKFTPEHKKHFLRKVGFTLQQQERGDSSGTTMPKHDLTQILIPEFIRIFDCNEIEALENVKEFIENVRTRSGLVVELSPGQYGFVHKTFQEYFAACYMAEDYIEKLDIQVMKDYVRQYINNPFWQEALLLALRSMKIPHTKEVLDYILNELNSYGAQDILQTDRYFVVKFLAEQAKWLGDDDFVKEQINVFLDWSLQNKERCLEWDQKNLDRFNNIMKMASDTSFKHAASGVLLTIAEDGKQDGYLRRYCAEAIGNLGNKNKAVIDRLLTIAEDGKRDGYLRRSCAEAIGNLGYKGKAVIDRLLTIAENKKQDDWLRFYCAEAIGRLGNKEKTVNILLTITVDIEQDDSLRRSCTEAIGNLGNKDKTIIDSLLTIAEDNKQDVDLRRSCASAIGNLGYKDKAVIDQLLTIAENGKQDGYLRHSCAYTIGRLGNKDKAINILLTIAEESKQDNYIRRECAEAIVKHGVKDKAANILLTIAVDIEQDRSLRRDCVEAIGKHGVKDKTIIDSLLILAEDNKQDVGLRRDCTEALGSLGVKEKAVIDRFLTIAEDGKQSGDLRRSCAEAIGRFGNKDKAINLLLTIAEETKQDGYIRRDCAEAIGRLGKKCKAVNMLLTIAIDIEQDRSLRCSCAEAIGKHGVKDKTIVDSLLTIAEDSKQDVGLRRDCTKALGKLGNHDIKTKAINILIQLYREKEDRDTYEALWELTGV